MKQVGNNQTNATPDIAYFSPNQLQQFVVQPLRYFFGRENVPQNLRWHPDPKRTKLAIYGANDINKLALEEGPRIVVERGGYQINKVGLSDNLAEQKTMQETKGRVHKINAVQISGSVNIYIDSRAEGECNTIADMASHFICWTRPGLCDEIGFKEFGLPMNISPTGFAKGSTEVFRIQISVPFFTEEAWGTYKEGHALNGILMSVAKGA